MTHHAYWNLAGEGSANGVARQRLVARAEDPESGRVLEVLSNQPGLQFYSSNHFNASRVGKAGKFYRQGDGFALEPQRFPDAVNRPNFESPRLDPGQTYVNRIVFKLSAQRSDARTSAASR